MNAWAVGYFARIAFVVIIAAIGMWCAMRKPELFGWKSLLCYYGARLSAMFVFVCVLKQVPSDVQGWYMHAHWMVGDGLFPGKGFLTPYALGFNALLALAVRCFDSPFAIVALFELAEIAAVPVLYDAFRRFADELTAKKILVLFLSSPITLYCLWLGAQDETLILLSVACVFWLIVVGCKGWVLCLASFFCFAFTKILSLFFLQPFFFCRKHRYVVLCALGFAGYLILAKIVGINPFNMVFGRSPGMDTVGDRLASVYTLGNIWFMFRRTPDFIQNSVFLACISFVTACPLFELWQNSKNDGELKIDVCLNMMCRWGIVFTMFYRMSFATYCACFLPFLLFTIVSCGKWHMGKMILMIIWSIVLSFKDSLYYGRQALSLDGRMATYVFTAYSVTYFVLVLLILVFVLGLNKDIIDFRLWINLFKVKRATNVKS